MENLFERAFFGGVPKNYGAKPFSFQAAVARKNLPAELSDEFFLNVRVKIDQLMHCLIGVKKFCGRQDLAQAIAKSRFARGNSARYPDRRHAKNVEYRNPKSKAMPKMRKAPNSKLQHPNKLQFSNPRPRCAHLCILELGYWDFFGA
jgi:hypothetical protein